MIHRVFDRAESLFAGLGAVDWTLTGFETGCQDDMRGCYDMYSEGECTAGPAAEQCGWMFHDPSNPDYGGYCQCTGDTCEFCPVSA